MIAPLDKLHDFYQPPPPSWKPQTIGWYILFAITGILLTWLAIHLVRKWRQNRYRREALRELPSTPLPQLSALLKRTALTVWQREKVASLNGPEWLNFLNKSAAEQGFSRSPGNLMEEVALRSGEVSKEDESELRRLAAAWIRRHRVQA
jgi:Domain of unknown function (DUF4381)